MNIKMDDTRICFIGDSLVNGTGDQQALGWAGRLCQAANVKDQVTYYNLGIRGNTSADVLARWDSEVTMRFVGVKNARVVLSVGINDTVMQDGQTRLETAASKQNFNQLLNQIKSRYKVIVIGPPPINDDQHNIRINELSKSFEQQANTLNIPFIEIYSKLIDDAEYKNEIAENDGAHPRFKGYEKITRIIQASGKWWF